MSELDDLRRVAYGRTSTPEEEAAAAAARAELEARERPVAPEPEEPEKPAILQIVDPSDEPGYLHQLATTWRVWAVPAFATFVIGIAITVASGLLILRSIPVGDGSAAPTVSAADAPVPGDLDTATAKLNNRQQPENLGHEFAPPIDPATVHLLHTSAEQQIYAAFSDNGDICLMVVDATTNDSGSTCLPPELFAAQSVWLGTSMGSNSVTVRWDGLAVTQTWK